MTDTPRLAPDYPVLTERLALRPIEKERDLPAIHAYRSIPEVCTYVPFVPSTLEEMAERFADPERTRSVLDAQAEGQVLFTVIERRDTGEVIGDLVLFWHSDADRHAEVGYVIHPDHEGQGYATEAVRALTDLAFDHAGAHRVSARLDERNTGSARLLERLGFRQEARFVDGEWFKGEWTTLLVYAVLDREWTVAQSSRR
ncbi:GNAT family protein [Nocardioides aestuarii]|uniref:GNAT family N-acetyltransferase n=1 Tax=Nocardioides aestuarii TaxID=252231 RepID=A0ABW4TKH2_9ACTN